jgi:RsiW-degrading membrane proteinase PrsW (M82 family)
MLIIGIVPLLVLVVICAIKYSQNKEAYYRNILVRSVVFGGVASLLLMLPANTILKLRHRHNPEYVNAVIAASENSGDEALQQKADEEWSKMQGEE